MLDLFRPGGQRDRGNQGGKHGATAEYCLILLYQREGSSMAIGIVKWFNTSKGYGFIAPSNGGDDLFAHFSAIEMQGHKSLKEGQEVEFEIQDGPKGPQAARIRALA